MSIGGPYQSYSIHDVSFFQDLIPNIFAGFYSPIRCNTVKFVSRHFPNSSPSWGFRRWCFLFSSLYCSLSSTFPLRCNNSQDVFQTGSPSLRSLTLYLRIALPKRGLVLAHTFWVWSMTLLRRNEGRSASQLDSSFSHMNRLNAFRDWLDSESTIGSRIQTQRNSKRFTFSKPHPPFLRNEPPRAIVKCHCPMSRSLHLPPNV